MNAHVHIRTLTHVHAEFLAPEDDGILMPSTSQQRVSPDNGEDPLPPAAPSPAWLEETEQQIPLGAPDSQDPVEEAPGSVRAQQQLAHEIVVEDSELTSERLPAD